MKLTIVYFTGYNRRLTKYFIEENFLMKKQAIDKIMDICNTAIIHTIEHYDISLLNKEEISKQILTPTKIILSDETQ